MKYLSIFMLSMVLVACPAKEDETSRASVDADCETDFTTYPKEGPVKAQMDWLAEHGEKLCEDVLYREVELDHKITSGPITYSDNGIVRKTPAELTAFIGTARRYEFYIGFRKNTAGELTDIKKVNPFAASETCYSIPLLRSLIKRAKPNSYFTFRNGQTGAYVAVIMEFYDGGVSTAFYDYTHHPTFTPQKSAL